MPITKGYRQLVDEAMAEVTTYSVEQVRQRLDDPPCRSSTSATSAN